MQKGLAALTLCLMLTGCFAKMRYKAVIQEVETKKTYEVQVEDSRVMVFSLSLAL